jgi:hypothetical protein
LFLLHLSGQYSDSSDEYLYSEEEGEVVDGQELADDEDIEEDTELLDKLYCVACDKLFKTEGAKVLLFSLILICRRFWLFIKKQTYPVLRISIQYRPFLKHGPGSDLKFTIYLTVICIKLMHV